MGLGPDKEISKSEFIEAMRARLEAEQSGWGKNVDQPSVADNLGALGEAVFKILTIHAETISNSSKETIFWQWVSEINAWLSSVRKWQKGIAGAFQNWAPVSTEGKNLKNAINAISDPGDPPLNAPNRMKGKIE
jgi:hypothetical protein